MSTVCSSGLRTRATLEQKIGRCIESRRALTCPILSLQVGAAASVWSNAMQNQIRLVWELKELEVMLRAALDLFTFEQRAAWLELCREHHSRNLPPCWQVQPRRQVDPELN